MKVSLKVLILVIVVLSLSILPIPKPGSCASAWEYGAQGNGIIAGFSGKGEPQFTPSTMTLTFNNQYVDEVLGVSFITGEMALSTTTRKLMFTATADNSGKIIMTTTTGMFGSGVFTSDGTGAIMPLVFQNPATAETGNFILKPKP